MCIHPILAILAHSYVALCIYFYVSTLPMLAPSYFYDFEFGLLGFSLISKSIIVLLCVLYFSMIDNVLLLFYMS